jgi:hypothetical protein
VHMVSYRWWIKIKCRLLSLNNKQNVFMFSINEKIIQVKHRPKILGTKLNDLI